MIVKCGESEVFAAIGEAVERSHLATVAKNMVLGFQDIGGGVGIRDDDGRNLAEVDVDDRAIFLGEAVEGDVGDFAQVVEVADDGEKRWAGREVLG